MSVKEDNILLEVKNLKTYFDTDSSVIKAVDDVSFNIKKGKTLGIVGESGCGKSMTSLSIMRLVPGPKGHIAGGNIIYNSKEKGKVDLTKLKSKGKEIRQFRGNEIAMIFQEPMTSLNPVYTVGEQIMEAVRLHQRADELEARKKAVEMLDLVNIPGAEERVDDYPHQFSGGMRQRAMIAMALSCNPSLLIADEPTTALDVTVEAQILSLMEEIQEKFNMSIMFITHDLDVIGEMADEVIVMYTGQIVEKASVYDIFYNPKHPYTLGLLNSTPKIGSKKRLEPIEGNVADLKYLPDGCYFAPRCPKAMDICHRKEPPTYIVGDEQSVKCWLYEGEED